MDSVLDDIMVCEACDLCEKETVVLGDGNLDADYMFIGEAPEDEESKTGKPFIGKCGKLLTAIINSMDLLRDDVYITNVIKARPPRNRNPFHEEVEGCSKFLFRQIEIVDPIVIICLGAFAAQTILRSEEKISVLRGNVFDYGKYKVVPTFHPSYLLKQSSKKKEVWSDMKLAMNVVKVTKEEAKEKE